MKDTSAAYDTALVLRPTCILPSQLALKTGHIPAPELQLVAAILEDALQCVFANVDAREHKRRQEFITAYRWICEDDSDWPFAFRNACDLLGLDYAAVRERIRSFIDRHGRETVVPLHSRTYATAPESRTASRSGGHHINKS